MSQVKIESHEVRFTNQCARASQTFQAIKVKETVVQPKGNSLNNENDEKIGSAKNKYLEVTYSDAPFTNYPLQLTKYLAEKYQLQPGVRLLDIGCGRGEFLNGFIKLGIMGYGFDQSDLAKTNCPTASIEVGDIEKRLPYEDNFFDVIYNKSVIEHFYYPERILMEIHRILQPGGLLITMTPDWSRNLIHFHEDFTHRTPFTIKSLDAINRVCNFSSTHTERFTQLPIVWKFPLIKIVTLLCRKLVPDRMKKYSKFVRFSKEIMLISVARK